MKYYKVIKDNFLWDTNAILKLSDSGYVSINPIYNKIEGSSEYITCKIVENSPEYFLQVYPVNLLTKTVYKIKAEALEMINKNFKE